MTTDNEHREQARELERIWIDADTPFDLLDTWGKKINDSDIGYVRADILSSRDTEIREVLEGLRSYTGCWCNFPESHVSHCLATRALWEKVQPKESNNVSIKKN